MKKVVKDIFLKLHKPHQDLAFLPERMIIGKVEKLVAISLDKTGYLIHIGKLIIH